MKILMTGDTIGGVWTYAMELAQALQPSTVQIALATMGAMPDSDQFRQAAQQTNLQLFPSPCRLEWMDDPWDDVRRAGQWLLQLAHDFQPDVIHLNGYTHGNLPWPAPLLMVAHSDVLSWWQAVKNEPAPAHWDHYRQAVTAGLHAADLVVAPTHAMLSALLRHYGPLPHTRVIYNARNPSLFPLAKKENFIFTVGRVWDEAKNVTAVAQAAAGLNWPVYVAGPQRHPDGRIAEHPNVRHLGRLSTTELSSWLSRCPIYALPARYEPFGLSILEAALAGCTLVLSDIPPSANCGTTLPSSSTPTASPNCNTPCNPSSPTPRAACNSPNRLVSGHCNCIRSAWPTTTSRPIAP